MVQRRPDNRPPEPGLERPFAAVSTSGCDGLGKGVLNNIPRIVRGSAHGRGEALELIEALPVDGCDFLEPSAALASEPHRFT